MRHTFYAPVNCFQSLTDFLDNLTDMIKCATVVMVCIHFLTFVLIHLESCWKCALKSTMTISHCVLYSLSFIFSSLSSHLTLNNFYSL